MKHPVNNGWFNADRDPIHMAAADWFARLRNPDVSLEETLAWQHWMNTDPRHARAFARVEEVSTLLRSMPVPPRPRAPAARLDRYDGSVALRDWREARRRVIGLALAASVGAAFVAVAWMLMSGVRPQTLETTVGENRTVKLADGSALTLGGDTEVTVSLGQKMRKITLAHGEAFFTVTKDPNRPFKVFAGNATVLAVGTAFNVHRRENAVAVTVTQGRVLVEPVSRLIPMTLLRELKSGLAPVSLQAGQQTIATGGGVEPAQPAHDLAAATAWQKGRLAFRLQPLSYVLEDVNRYSSKPIVAADEEVAALTVTGTVMAYNVKGWIGSLENALDLQAREETDRIVLQRRRW